MKPLILTVTLNPAIDRTVTVESFAIDKVNRVKSIQRDAGGKGINVSKTIKALGGQSKALAILGGRNGQWLVEESQRLGLSLVNVPIEGETRENIKIVDPISKQYTDLNESGPCADDLMVERLIATIREILQEGDFLVLSGSALPGMPEDVFKRIIERTKGKDIQIILDVDGTYLEKALEAQPDFIKPNIDELEGLLGKSLKTEKEIIEGANGLLQMGIKRVVVSRGEEGLLWIDQEKVVQANAIPVVVKSTVGAGDSVVAALVTGLSQGKSPEDIVKLAIATAASVVMTEGSRTGSLNDLETLRNKVTLNVKKNSLGIQEGLK